MGGRKVVQERDGGREKGQRVLLLQAQQATTTLLQTPDLERSGERSRAAGREGHDRTMLNFFH